VLSISYDSGKEYFNNENCLRLLGRVVVADDNGNEVHYRFLKNERQFFCGKKKMSFLLWAVMAYLLDRAGNQ